MELSKFLQQDIIEFLDKKSDERREQRGKLRSEEVGLFNVDKDYAKETETALQERNFEKARRIFDDLREAYNGLEKDSEQREKIYAILEEVYAKIKEGMRAKGSLEEDLASFEEGMRTLREKDPQAEAFDEEATRTEQEREAAEQELKRLLALISDDVERDDVRKAVEHYNQLKEAFQRYPSSDKYRKIDWYNQVLGTYEQIRRLQQQATAAKEHEQEAQEEDQKREAQAHQEEEAAHRALASQRLKDAKAVMRALIESLDQGDLKKSTSLLIDAKHEVASLDKSLRKEKESLQSIIDAVTHRLAYLKHQGQERKEEERAQQAQEQEEEQRQEEARRRRALGEAQNAEDLYHQGLEHQHHGRTEEAKACYQAILKIAPNHLPAQIRLEQLEERQGEPDHGNAAA